VGEFLYLTNKMYVKLFRLQVGHNIQAVQI